MSEPVPEPLRLVVDAGARYRLSVYGVGLACCAVEVVAARTALLEASLLEAAELAPPSPADLPEVEVMVVAGTVTDRMLPALLEVYEALPEPRAVLSFGACAGTGGPYWDSYVVTKGVDQLLPVDVWVAGCPPRPEALLQGLQALDAQRTAA
jgi:NADH-quinone oxidoreductase subunit B